MKQLRIDFPDYTADNQERDAKKYAEKQQKDIYIVKVRGTYGAYLPQDILPYSTHSQGEGFIDFIKEVKSYCEEKLEIKPRFRCILNKGIEDYIQRQIEINKLLDR